MAYVRMTTLGAPSVISDASDEFVIGVIEILGNVFCVSYLGFDPPGDAHDVTSRHAKGRSMFYDLRGESHPIYAVSLLSREEIDIYEIAMMLQRRWNDELERRMKSGHEFYHMHFGIEPPSWPR